GSFLRGGSGSGTDYLLSGFGSLSVAVNDALDLGAGLTMSAPVGGSIALTGSRVTIAGTVSAPSGSIAISGTQGTPMVTLASGATLTTAGSWINDRPNASPRPFPHLTKGGRITIGSAFGVGLAAGSLIDVSGGGSLDAAGKLGRGDAGSITIQAGSGEGALFNGSLHLAGALHALALGKGGKLDLTAPRLALGAPASLPSDTTLVPAALFQDDGFSQLNLNAQYRLEVADGARIAPVQSNLLIDPVKATQAPTGANLQTFASRTALPTAQRGAAGLALSSKVNEPVAGAGVYIGSKAQIDMDPQAAVSLSSR